MAASANKLPDVLLALLLLLCVGLLTTGCDASGEEASSSRTYAATEVNGSALPVEYQRGKCPKFAQADRIYTVESASLELMAGKEMYRLELDQQYDCVGVDESGPLGVAASEGDYYFLPSGEMVINSNARSEELDPYALSGSRMEGGKLRITLAPDTTRGVSGQFVDQLEMIFSPMD